MTFPVEFQAIVLAAGKGSRMPEITAGKPKCLLPVGHKPLVWYPLHKLQQTGFREVFLVVLENQKNEIQNTVDKLDLDLKIDYVTVPGNEDIGTADSLRLMNDKIKSDILVLSCDTITDVNLRDFLELYRKHDASICTLLFPPQLMETTNIPGSKSKHKPERDLIGIDAQTKRLVFLASASDFENELTLPRTLIKKHPHVTIHSNLIDSHIYIIKNWVLNYLKSETSISTLKGELLPHIIKKQLYKPSAKRTDTNTSTINAKIESDILYHSRETALELLIRDRSTFNDHTGDNKPCYHEDSIRCYAYISDPCSFGIRVNTIPAYWTINNKILAMWDKIAPNVELKLIDSKADIKSNQVDKNCFIWNSTKLYEKTSFKNCIIGSNSEVNSFSRVFNSVVMNNVVLKEKVALENCIVCDGAIIENGCNLKGCLVGSQHVVHEKSDHTNEVLTDVNRLMEF